MTTNDISMEPLLNQSAEGSGVDKKLAFVPINLAGAASNRATQAIGNVTAWELTPTLGKRTIEIQNTGTNEVYFGGSGVTSATGIILRPQQGKIFANIQDTFSLYFICAAGETSTLRIVEYS